TRVIISCRSRAQQNSAENHMAFHDAIEGPVDETQPNTAEFGVHSVRVRAGQMSASMNKTLRGANSKTSIQHGPVLLRKQAWWTRRALGEETKLQYVRGAL